MSDVTHKVSFRLNSLVYETAEAIAKEQSISTEAFFQRIVTRHVIEHARKEGLMAPEHVDRLQREQNILKTAARRARELDEAGAFDEHFTLTVIRDLMTDPDFRADYETVIGGDAYQSGLPGKSPINMYLGWYVKNAVPNAAPLRDANGKPRRVQVRNEPIQSYTLLAKA